MITGYEIHMGKTEFDDLACQRIDLASFSSMFHMADQTLEGLCAANGRIWGTYLHGVFHNDEFRRQWLNMMRSQRGLAAIQDILPFAARQVIAFDRLADETRKSLDMQLIYDIAGLPSHP
jgi:adenosylcobyric acid synthase